MATRLIRTNSVPYTPEQMYALVNDIQQYPAFVPLCTKATVLNQQSDQIQARLEFTKGFWRQSFTTQNQLSAPKLMQIQLLDGPFHHLTGTWSFEEVSNLGCKVSLLLDFEFKNKLLGFTMGPMIQQMATQVVQAFTQRAEQVYGKPVY